jgi:hypothetical protein
MPKSRNRKGKKSASATKGKRDVVSMTPLMRDALLEQREAFIKKFGREPGPGDPVFFDPDADTPTQISWDRMELLSACRPLRKGRLLGGPSS